MCTLPGGDNGHKSRKAAGYDTHFRQVSNWEVGACFFLLTSYKSSLGIGDIQISSTTGAFIITICGFFGKVFRVEMTKSQTDRHREAGLAIE